MDRLMRVLEAEIEEMPHNLVRVALEKKLKEKGVVDEGKIEETVNRILSGQDECLEWDDGIQEDVTIEFTQQDEDEILGAMNDFLEGGLQSFIQETVDDCVSSMLQHYRQIAGKALYKVRNETKGFEERTFERWKPAFDHLEMLWHIAQELGEAHGKDVQLRNDEDNNATMAALAHVFPKSLLVVQEIICLLKGGFPDGALTRWRSLHELSVTAMYIAKHGEDAAKQYLLSFHFSARRAAHQMNRYSERSGLKSFTAEEIQVFDERCAEAERVLGRSIDKDKNGEWPKITNSYPTFAQIEESVGMDHWRPWYKWASSYTHANHRPADKSLGLAETTVPVNLVGSSNSGFVDPFQLTALSLAQLVATYLTHSINLDRIVHIDVFRELANEMADIALKSERDTKKAFEVGNEQTLKD